MCIVVCCINHNFLVVLHEPGLVVPFWLYTILPVFISRRFLHSGHTRWRVLGTASYRLDRLFCLSYNNPERYWTLFSGADNQARSDGLSKQSEIIA